MVALGTVRNPLTALAVVLMLSACFGGSSSEDSSDPPPPAGNPPPPPPAQNRPPTISGTPTTTLVVGEAYDFRPTASDPDGDTLAFSIQNRPSWANFNTATGRLNGTPGAGNVGQFSNVLISVSDGQASAQLNAFAIDVNQIALGSVTLSWTPPTTNSDGSPITNLAGYRIYFGRSADSLDTTVSVSNAGTTRYVVENLSLTTWYFSMTSYNSQGIESARSAIVSRTLT